jgi:hypothetical protein
VTSDAVQSGPSPVFGVYHSGCIQVSFGAVSVVMSVWERRQTVDEANIECR